MKVTIAQRIPKNLFTKEELTKIEKERPNFLLLPPLYGIPEINKSPKELVKESKEYLDRALEVTEVYKGVVIGGLVPHEHKAGVSLSIPILQDLQIIDYYHSPIAKWNGNSYEPIPTESSFIVGGFRFAILAGMNTNLHSQFAEFKSAGINLCFFQRMNFVGQKDYEADAKEFVEYAKTLNGIVFKNDVLDPTLKDWKARSFFVNPTGVTWKVGESEWDKQVTKTINYNLSNNLFSSL